MFFSIESFIRGHVGLDKWNQLTEDEKIFYSKKIAKIVVEHVNQKSYSDIQCGDFNSQRQDFRIVFEQEIIARSGLFVAKKHYGLGIVDKDGIRKEELFIRGLDIVQSSTPRAIKPRLKNILNLIITGEPDKVISKTIRVDKREIAACHPNDIAENIGVNNLNKYIVNGKAVKGAPYSVKAINNYHNLLEMLTLASKYERIGGVGEKTKIVYIAPNRFNIESLAFKLWPPEFDQAGIKIDYELMIDKFYLKKIESLLEPINKQNLVRGGNIGGFFG